MFDIFILMFFIGFYILFRFIINFDSVMEMMRLGSACFFVMIIFLIIRRVNLH
jgi:hypothetical protein